MLPHVLSLYIRTSIVSHTTNGSSRPTRVSRESSSSLTSSPSVSLSSSGPLHLLNSSSGSSLLSFGVLSPFSSLVPQLCRRHRRRIRLRVLGPPRYRPDDIGRRRPRRHRQHRAPRFRPERRPPQQMDWRGPPSSPKHRIDASRRVDRRGRRCWLTLRRLDLQRRLELRQLPRGLTNAALLALLACFGPAAALWSSLAIRRHRHRQFSWYTCRPWALPWLFPAS